MKRPLLIALFIAIWLPASQQWAFAERKTTEASQKLHVSVTVVGDDLLRTQVRRAFRTQLLSLGDVSVSGDRSDIAISVSVKDASPDYVVIAYYIIIFNNVRTLEKMLRSFVGDELRRRTSDFTTVDIENIFKDALAKSRGKGPGPAALAPKIVLDRPDQLHELCKDIVSNIDIDYIEPFRRVERKFILEFIGFGSTLPEDSSQRELD
jgi:hypothetical protein